MPLEGTHHVRALKSALVGSRKPWPHTKHRMELRRHTLKLRFWGERVGNEVLDLDYESIQSMPNSDVYELRISQQIGGQKNIRVIFYVPARKLVPQVDSPLPAVWVLEALPKKRNDWTTFDIARFKALRAVVLERFYHSNL